MNIVVWFLRYWYTSQIQRRSSLSKTYIGRNDADKSARSSSKKFSLRDRDLKYPFSRYVVSWYPDDFSGTKCHEWWKFESSYSSISLSMIPFLNHKKIITPFWDDRKRWVDIENSFSNHLVESFHSPKSNHRSDLKFDHCISIIHLLVFFTIIILNRFITTEVNHFYIYKILGRAIYMFVFNDLFVTCFGIGYIFHTMKHKHTESDRDEYILTMIWKKRKSKEYPYVCCLSRSRLTKHVQENTQ